MIRLETQRLVLRPPIAADAPAIQRIAGDRRVALTTAAIPHPYPNDGAARFVEQIEQRSGPDQQSLAIRLKATDELLGMAGFKPASPANAELTYMIAPAHWRQGYATEAAGAIIGHLLAETRFTGIVASAMVANRASERVLQKLGFCWVREAIVDIPSRGGALRISYWRLDAGAYPVKASLIPHSAEPQ